MFEKIGNLWIGKTQPVKAAASITQNSSSTSNDNSSFDRKQAEKTAQENELRSYVSRMDLDKLVNPLDGNAKSAESIGIAAFSTETNKLFFQAKTILNNFSTKAYELLYKLFADINSGQYSPEEISDKIKEFKNKIDELKKRTSQMVKELQIISDGVLKAAKAADEMKSKGVTTFYLADTFGDLSKMMDTDVCEKKDGSEKKQKITEKLSQLEERNRNLENRLKQKDLNEQDRAQATTEFNVNKIAIETMKKLLKSIE